MSWLKQLFSNRRSTASSTRSSGSEHSSGTSSKPSLDSDDTKEIQPPAPNHYFEYEFDAVTLQERWHKFHSALSVESLREFIGEYRRQEELLGTKEEFQAQRQLTGLSLPYLEPRLLTALEQGTSVQDGNTTTWVTLVEILSRASYNIAVLSSESCRRLIGQLIGCFRALIAELRGDAKDGNRTSLLGSHRSREDLAVHEPVAELDLEDLYRSLNGLQALVTTFGQLSSPGHAWRHQYQIEALKLQLNVRGMSALIELNKQCLFSNDVVNLLIDLLRVIHSLTAEQLNGSRVTYELMMSALNLIGGLVHDCPTAQPFLDKSPVLFELLAEHLGWPSDVSPHWAIAADDQVTPVNNVTANNVSSVAVTPVSNVTPVISAHDLFMFELLTIQVFTELSILSSTNMRRWRTTGGFQRVIDWVLWTAVTFQKKLSEPAPDSIWQVASFTPYLSRLTLGKHVTSQGMTRVTSDEENSPREPANNNPLTPTPPRPWHICNVPLAMIFQVLYCLCVGGLQASYAQQTSASNAPNLNLQVLNVLMDLFNSDIRQTPQNVVAREWLSDTCPECQLLVLDFVSRLAVDFPAVKPQLLACNLWPTLSSHYFFAPLLWHVTDAAARGLNIEHPLVKNVTGTYLFLEHRRYLFQLIEFLATLGDSCHFECATLLTLWQQCYVQLYKSYSAALTEHVTLMQALDSSDHHVTSRKLSLQPFFNTTLVLESRAHTLDLAAYLEAYYWLSHLLSRLLAQSRGELTRQILLHSIQLNIATGQVLVTSSTSALEPSVKHLRLTLPLLCNTGLLLTGVNACQPEPTEHERQDRHVTRQHVLDLIGAVLGMTSTATPVVTLALVDDALLELMFGLLRETSMRRWSYNWLISALGTVPTNGDDKSQLLKLATKYLNYMCALHFELKEDEQLLLFLLQGLRMVAGGRNNKSQQDLLREAGAFVKLSNMLTGVKGVDRQRLDDLSSHVLGCLTALMANNAENKEFFSKSIGVSQFKTLLLEAYGDKLTARVLNGLLFMMTDGQDLDDDSPSSLIQNSAIALLLFSLTPNLAEEEQGALYDHVIRLVSKHDINQSILANTNLIYQLLDLLPQITAGPVQERALSLVALLSKQGITVRELKKLFTLFKPVGDKRSPLTPVLVQVLEAVARASADVISASSRDLENSTVALANNSTTQFTASAGSSSFFEFNGRHSAVTLLSTCQWPLGLDDSDKPACSVALWLRATSWTDPSLAPLYLPRLCSLLKYDGGTGVEIYFRPSWDTSTAHLVVSLQPSRDQAPVLVEFTAHPLLEREWYHVTLTYLVTSRKNTELHLYVNGRHVQHECVRAPYIFKGLDCVRIGSNAEVYRTTGTIYRESSFYGQMANIYWFSDELTAPHVAAIYRLGPNYMANFQGDSATEVAEQLDLSVNQAMQLLSEVRAMVHVAFMSQACVQLSPDVKLKSVPTLLANAPLTPVNERAVSEADSLCYDCSPESLPRARRHAVLTGVSVITRSILHDIVNCLGGVSALLPLFQQLDLAEDSEHVTAPLYTFAADIVRVMAWLLVAPPRSEKTASSSSADEWHRQHQIKFYHQGGFPVVSYLLLRSSPQNLTVELLDALQLFLKEYKQPHTRAGILIEPLEDDLFLHLFFNFHLWIYAEYAVQKHLLTRVLPFYVAKIKRLRTVFGVQPFLDALRLYYWTARDAHSMAAEAVHHPVSGTCVGRRPDERHVLDLQRDLVALVELTVQDGITVDETRALLQFMIDCKENGQLILVLKMMVRLLLAPNQSGTYLLNAILTLGGTDTLLLLLDNPNKSVQVLVLMLIDLIIENVKSTPAKSVSEGQDSPSLNRNLSAPLASIATNSSNVLLTDSLARLPPIFPIKAITNASTASPVSTPALTTSDSSVAPSAEKSPLIATSVMKSRSRRLFRQKSASRVKISQMMARAVSLSEDMSPLTAILTHHLTGHVDQPNNTNAASDESRDESGEGDLARSAASTRHELYNILFAMLVGKWHESSSTVSSGIVTGVNDDLAEPHVGKIFVDDKVTLTHFPVLEVLFGLVQSHASTTHLLLQDLALLLQRHDNCHAFKRLAGWHVHLLSLLFDADSVTFDIVCQIYKWLLLDALQHDKDGWTLLHETEAYCTQFSDKGVDAARFMNQLIRSVVAELCKESWNYNKTTKDTARMSVLRALHERDSALKNNLMLFVLFVEEYLYYRLDGTALPANTNSDRNSDHVLDEDDEEQRNNSLDEEKFTSYHVTMIIRARGRDGHQYDEEYGTARDATRGRAWRDADIAMNLVDLVMNLNLAKIIQISVPQPNSSGTLKRTLVRVREGGLRQLVFRLVSACLYEHSETDLAGDHARLVRDFLVRTIPQLHAIMRKKTCAEEVHYTALHLLRALKLRHMSATWQEISSSSATPSPQSQAAQLISDTIKETKASAVMSKSALVRDHGDLLAMIHWLQDLLVNHVKSPLIASFKKDNLPHEQQRKVKDVVAQLTQGYHANGPLNLQPGADSGHVFKISSSTYQSPLLSPTFIAAFLTLVQGTGSSAALTYLEAYLASRAAPLTTHESDMAQSILKTRVKWLAVTQRQIDEYLTRQNLNIMETTRRIEHVKTSLFSESQFEQRIHELKMSLKDAYARIANQWKRILRSLNNERGPWCPQQPSRVYWKLDKTENSLRMRLKLKRNYNFNDHRDAVQHKETRDASAINSKGLDEYERLRLLKLPVRRDFMERYEEEEVPDDQIVTADTSTALGASSEIQIITRKSSSAAQQTPAPPAPSYRVMMRVAAEWITPSNVYQGQLALVLVSADNSCHVTFSEDLAENAPNNARARKMKHWAVHDIRGMHMRRYLLRRSAVELFMNDQTNNLFNLSKKDCQRLYQKIIGLKPLSLLSITEMKLTPDQILLASGLCDKWRHRHISNLEYLMHLNTIAGRTYNDLTQYPVVPWVLQDYTSPVLDLDNPRVYRDLSKPIGAINAERLKYFQDRYEQWESMQDQGSVPPFHYGSHYSSAGVVLYYLIRVEPFTTLHIQLQGGKFDHTDRLFHSIEQTWHSCTHDTSDVKELIPEFFYFPEFLTNHNSFDFGTKQNGIKMNDVILPPWANNSPELFIRLHRRALESEYVSLHLHKWIDLVFGYLQRGHPAREANNVFYYLTYEGAVDLDEITDPVLKVSTRDQIAHFGQTPSQLLKVEPHVARFPLTTDLSNHYRSIFVRPDMLDIYRINLEPVNPSGANNSSGEPSGAIVYLSCAMMNDRVIAVDEYGLIRIYRLIRPLTWQHVESNHPFKYLPNYRQRLDHHATDDQSMTLDTSRHGQHLTTRHSTHQFAISPDGRTLYSAAHWDGTAKVVAIDSHSLSSVAGGSSSQTALSLSPVGLVHSKPPLTCLALAEDGGLLVTGCADTTLTVWTVHGPGITAANPASNVISPQRTTAKSPLLPVTLHPRHVLYGHDREITAVAISRDLDVCISGSRDGTCLVHTLKQGQYVRALQLPHANASIDMIVICATTGHFVVYSKSSLTLYLYTINGKLLAQTDANDHLNHMVVTKDGEYLISGGRKGTVVIRTLFTLQTVHKFQVDAAVCSLALTAEEKHLLVGLDNGKMILFYPRGL